MVDSDPLIGTLLGQYRIESVLGKGGMATVYRGIQVAVNRVVAIKVLPGSFMHDETFMTRFRQEAEVAAQLEHIRILPIYDYGEQDGIPYIVMRYIYGGTLRDLTQQGPLTPDTTLHIVSQVAEALDYAHSRRVIHRDLKPSNIMLDMEANVYLTDFGTAKLRDRSAQLTGSGIVGTPAYMAPEQSMPGRLTPAVDIYALGVTLFEMITGHVPYAADTPIVQILMHIQHPVPSLLEYNPTVHPQVDEILKRAMAKRPEDRYSKATELTDALSNAIATTGGWSIDTPVRVPVPDRTGDTNLQTPSGTLKVRPHSEQPAGEEETPIVPLYGGSVQFDGPGVSSAPEKSTGAAGRPSPYDYDRQQSSGLTGNDAVGDSIKLPWSKSARAAWGPAVGTRPMLVAQSGRVYELVTSNVLIGRSDPRKGIFVDIDLSDMDIKKRCSRSHARILERDGVFYIWDLHSMNGTYLNGRRMVEGGRQMIEDGDVIQFGKDGVTLIFQVPAS